MLSCGLFQSDTPEELPYNWPVVSTTLPSLWVKNVDISSIDAENWPNVPIGKNVIGSNASSSYSSTNCNYSLIDSTQRN